MEYTVDISQELEQYVMGIMAGYDENQVRHRILKMSFKDFYELHVAYKNKNEHKVVELLSGIAEGQGDNPYSSIRPGSKENNNIKPIGTDDFEPDEETPSEKDDDLDSDEIEDLKRLSDLAGIDETSSGGCSGAGGIASAPATMGSVQKRPTSSMPKKTKPKKKTT